MSKEEIIVLLIVAIVVSKAIIIVLIKYLVQKNQQLKKERLSLEIANNDLKKNLYKIKVQEQELREAENFKLKVFSIASHDLRMPFANLKSLLDILEIKEIDKKDLKDILLKIKNQSSVSHEMLDNVLRWTAGQLRHGNMEKQGFRILEQTTKTVTLFNDELAEKKIDLLVAIPDTLTATGNSDIFSFVIRNIISNAIKFSATESVIEIGVRLNVAENPETIYIVDQGQGMDNTIVESILDGSFGVNITEAKNYQSAGIGLSLCRDLIKHAGWSLAIVSEVGKGTRCEIGMPLDYTISSTAYA